MLLFIFSIYEMSHKRVLPVNFNIYVEFVLKLTEKPMKLLMSICLGAELSAPILPRDYGYSLLVT